ncbi:hypothetical protein NPIL_674901 [Nephila pilipes]|uniref:Uncharacterized protein n=1 Tax=Nephila pilipes TaxID=299642 RepID=A0A8X6TET1_NEPPI|nr:hypothetical protein NPIL_674901 [Nephila pilipes]
MRIIRVKSLAQAAPTSYLPFRRRTHLYHSAESNSSGIGKASVDCLNRGRIAGPVSSQQIYHDTENYTQELLFCGRKMADHKILMAPERDGKNASGIGTSFAWGK